VLFGGSGPFIQEIRLREAFNDLWIWNTDRNEKWVCIEGKGLVPKIRMHHAAAVLGGILLVMGGINTEA